MTASTASANRIEPGSFSLAAATLPNLSTSRPDKSAQLRAVDTFIEAANHAFSSNNAPVIAELFLDDSCYWRDQLCISWDFHTLSGRNKIAAFLNNTNDGCRIKSFSLQSADSPTGGIVSETMIGPLHAVRALLQVETNFGRGAGVVYLLEKEGAWKIFSLFTSLLELEGHSELAGARRPLGNAPEDLAGNWADQRRAQTNFISSQPVALILGGGQAGLSIAARLNALGVTSLIIEQNNTIGDSWHKRYHSLVLHDPVWLDHLPYLPFPETWPIYTPKDKLGFWLNHYTQALELNAWSKSKLTEARWIAGSREWKVTIERTADDGTTRTEYLSPKHIIQATGHSGEPYIPTHLPGFNTFQGLRSEHSSKFLNPDTTHKGCAKKVIIVGACNSAHDIAKDYAELGYKVTMVQRSSTFVITNDTNRKSMAPLYGQDSPKTEDADLILFSLPNTILKTLNVGLTDMQNQADERILQGLNAAGFKTDKGVDNSGLWLKYLQRGGGYYLDSGCSQLIIDGRILVKSGQEISEVLPNGLKFADGDVIEADEIVWATGYGPMKDVTRRIFGDKVADKVKDVWGLDEEGEIRTLWRKSGHEGFWLMAGNLALCRWYSRQLALQIKAIEVGLVRWEDI